MGTTSLILLFSFYISIIHLSALKSESIAAYFRLLLRPQLKFIALMDRPHKAFI